MERDDINRAIDAWNNGGGLSHSLAEAVMAFEDSRKFPDFKWRFDPVIREELLDSIEENERGVEEYRRKRDEEMRANLARLEADRLRRTEERLERERKIEARRILPAAPRVSPSPERDAKIVEMRKSGGTLRAVGAAFGISPERVRNICNLNVWAEKRREEIAQRERERATIAWNVRRGKIGGHPSIVDDYGVTFTSTAKDIYLDDRFLTGKTIGDALTI